MVVGGIGFASPSPPGSTKHAKKGSIPRPPCMYGRAQEGLQETSPTGQTPQLATVLRGGH